MGGPGWLDYRRRGNRLDEPDGVWAATNGYQRRGDTIGRFIHEWCDTAPGLRETTSGLYRQWERWCTDEGAASLSLKAFGVALDAQGYAAGKPVNGKRWRYGIALKPPDERVQP